MILIVGRTGSGKDYLANILEKKGLRVVKSYTTRPKRSENEDTHIFVTKKEAKELKDRVAATVINKHLYFATREQVENSDVYIIDPNGLYELVKKMPNEKFYVVYVKADAYERERKALARAKDYVNELRVYERRCGSEDMQFTQFEEKLSRIRGRSQRDGLLDIAGTHNVVDVSVYVNDYNSETAEKFASSLVRIKESCESQLAV